MLEAIDLTRAGNAETKQVTAQPAIEIEYPESDGEPMAETDTHLEQMVDALLHPLKERYRNDPHVYISGNLFLYYEEGNPKAVVAPDVFVVFGVPKEKRRIYKLWEEGQAPDVIFELTSKKTYQVDLSHKRLLYEELGVREYFLFDPLHEYLRPPLQAFRLTKGYYTPIMPQEIAEGEWQLESEVLGLTLQTAGSFLRLFDPHQGRYLLSRAEEAEARREAEEARHVAEEARHMAETQLAYEVEARRALEEEVTRLRTLLEK